MLEEILKSDRELLIYLNNLGSEQWDAFWLFITNQFNWVPLFAFVLFLIFRSLGWKRGLFVMLVATVMVTFSDQFTNVIRGVFERLRPNNDPTINKLIRVGLHPGSYSFTSGHATTSTAFVIFTIFLLKDKVKYLKWLLLFPMVFAYSRIYLGVHFPIDIFCGAINGTIIGYTFYKIYAFSEKKLFN